MQSFLASARLRLPVAALAALVFVAFPAAVTAVPKRVHPGAEGARGFLDVRTTGVSPAGANVAQARLQRSLGLQGVVDLDPLTGTPRVVAKLDGFLTSPSDRDAKAVVLDYVRARPGVFKLDANDLAGLRLVRDYTDIGGTHHFVWAQVSRGVPVFDNDLRASVTSNGRLINVLGSPIADLQAPAIAPRLGAADAVGAALRSVGRGGRVIRTVTAGRDARRTTRFADGHRAALVLLYDGHSARLAWKVTAHADGDEVYDTVVDAADGSILHRANKVDSIDALAWDYYPGAPAGGNQEPRDITAWLNPSPSRLIGPNAHVFSDLDDNDIPIPGVGDPVEEVAPTGGNWNYAFTAFEPADAFCLGPSSPPEYSVCSWDSVVSESWDTNRTQNATQIFYFVNNFHDHLEAAPIGFDAPAGAFDASDDILKVHADDGANVGGTFLGPNMPDADHVNNANMLTPPDGESPTMQMYLFTWYTINGETIPFADVNGGDDATVVYHEYTHGLSNRLVTYSADGSGALDAHQSGAMGEGWSDWYAMDYLAAEGFQADTAAAGEVAVGRYLDNGTNLLRTEPLDCPRGPASAACPGSPTAGGGGYTLGDLGKVFPNGPEVHADGEIWAQTLWQLRQAIIDAHGPALGVEHARTLVTRAMETSPTNPSFLKMRDSILQADRVNFAGLHKAIIWQVFANRGMGYLAWTAGANSVSTVQDFSLPRNFSCVGKVATRIGTNGRDVINGTGGPDVIVGNGGNDTIKGRGGNDIICGGAGRDTLIGGTGADKFDGGTGNDTIYARDGRRERTIKGGTGTDRARKDRSDRTRSVERFF